MIDTSGAYIPGHGTPTVILFARNQKPVSSTFRTVMGIRGEPATPEDPAQGTRLVSDRSPDRPAGIAERVRERGDSPRELFHKHPWSIGGGGAAELKEQFDETAGQQLRRTTRVDRIRRLHARTMRIFVMPRLRRRAKSKLSAEW